MSFARPTLSDLIARSRADLDGRLPGADSRTPRSLLDVLARTHAGALSGAYGYLDAIALDVMPDTADTDHLDRWATIWGVTRKVAIAATGAVELAGVDGAIVPANSLLLRSDGAEYLIVAQTALVGGAATVNVTAVDAGAGGNAIAGTPLTFASPAAGITATATVGNAGLVGGGDQEEDQALLARLLARIQTPPQGGSSADYVAWALAQPEVTRAWVYPGWVGAGSVGIAVVMDHRETIFPTVDDCAAIAAAIDPLRPVTANVVVFAPTPQPADFTLSITPSTDATKAAVVAELTDLFAREAAPGGTVLISHIREAIAVAAGVTDYTLEVPAGNFICEPGFMPVLGNIVWLD